MSHNNPFSNNSYDLGIGDDYGLDKDTVSENLLRTAYSQTQLCYVCNYNTPQYRVVPKKAKYNNAQLQNGLYICGHCISLKPVDSKQYALERLQ